MKKHESLKHGDNSPPPFRWWLKLLIGADALERVGPDLEEFYQHWVKRHGVRRARVIFFTQSVRIVVWKRANRPDKQTRSVSIDGRPKGFLIDLLIPIEHADHRLHGLLEGYERWIKKYGVRTAKRMFATHSVGIVIEFWVSWVLRRIRMIRSPRT